MHDTLPLLQPSSFPALKRRPLEILQINIGLRCNLACLHCHVNSNPYRREKMAPETIAAVIGFLKNNAITTLDITGGAPEMHPQFRELVKQARVLGVHVIDRCNLTILQEPGYEDLAEFLADRKVEIIASLPCYSQSNVDQQRGKGVYQASIRALKQLNSLGYGTGDPELKLNLVYNPLGPSLPPSQQELEKDYKAHLWQEHGIQFDQLYTLCNMPIKRFGSTLVSRNQFRDYMTLLKGAHRDENLENVMCRNLVSVDWRGYLYDCDFNQMLGLAINGRGGEPLHISQQSAGAMAGMPITVRDHCYGCTAGQGSSCGGALSS